MSLGSGVFLRAGRISCGQQRLFSFLRFDFSKSLVCWERVWPKAEMMCPLVQSVAKPSPWGQTSMVPSPGLPKLFPPLNLIPNTAWDLERRKAGSAEAKWHLAALSSVLASPEKIVGVSQLAVTPSIKREKQRNQWYVHTQGSMSQELLTWETSHLPQVKNFEPFWKLQHPCQR